MDRYKVLKRIGVGTYGSAYLVTLKADPNKAFVLKKVKVDDGGEKERMQAEKEAAVLMQLDHPLVLRCLGCCKARVEHALIMLPLQRMCHQPCHRCSAKQGISHPHAWTCACSPPSVMWTISCTRDTSAS